MTFLFAAATALVSLGIILFAAALGISAGKKRDWAGLGFVVCFMLPLGVLAAAIPVSIILEKRGDTLATLKDDEWACTSSRQVSSNTVSLVGKVTVITPTSTVVCDQYTRLGQNQ